MDKAIEAAARAVAMHAVGAGRAKQFDAYWESAREEIVATTEVAIRAYLSALKEDPEVIKRVGDEIHHWTALNMEWGPIGYDRIARAALSAIEVE